jgi:hypothetical protein
MQVRVLPSTQFTWPNRCCNMLFQNATRTNARTRMLTHLLWLILRHAVQQRQANGLLAIGGSIRGHAARATPRCTGASHGRSSGRGRCWALAGLPAGLGRVRRVCSGCAHVPVSQEKLLASASAASAAGSTAGIMPQGPLRCQVTSHTADTDAPGGNPAPACGPREALPVPSRIRRRGKTTAPAHHPPEPLAASNPYHHTSC